jgi:hypothetical protein
VPHGERLLGCLPASLAGAAVGVGVALAVGVLRWEDVPLRWRNRLART